MSERNYTRASLSAGDRPGLHIPGGDTQVVNRQAGALFFKAVLFPVACLVFVILRGNGLDTLAGLAAGGTLLGGPFLLAIRELISGQKLLISLYADFMAGKLRLYRGTAQMAFFMLFVSQAGGAALLCMAVMELARG